MFLVFQGTSANSEPETKAIASTIQQFKNNIRIYMSFHSFGEYKVKKYVLEDEIANINMSLLEKFPNSSKTRGNIANVINFSYVHTQHLSE